MRRLAVSALITCCFAQAQDPLRYRLVDAGTGAALPFAPIAYLGTGKGTITNEEGAFQLPAAPASDSLRITYIGYATRTLAWDRLPADHIVRMRPNTRTLDELTVEPGDEQYARVMAAARWMNRAPLATARLFFGMDTRSDSLPVEVLHAFYNLTTRSGHIEDLELKQGRIGITDKNGRFFINYNTTRAFALMDPLEQRQLFPLSPLACDGTAHMRKLFVADLISSGDGADAVDHVRVRPRTKNKNGFTLDLWLAKDQDRVVALELTCTHCATHPFVPLFEHGRIDSVDLRYRQTWTNEGRPMPEVIQLDYRMSYSGPGFSDDFVTHAVMHAYDRTIRFVPLLFDFAFDLPDYRKLAWLPNDTAFWQRNPPPLPSERQRYETAFLQEHDLRTSDWSKPYGNERDFFGSHYALWAPDQRMVLKLVTPQNGKPFKRIQLSEWTGQYAINTAPPLVLAAQLMLDLDTVNGTLHHRSYTVLDGLRSFDHLVEQPWTMAFHNIWFDLCEMHRRALEADLEQPWTTLAKVRQLHAYHTERMRATTDSLINSTRYGEDFEALRPWNDRVRESLGIDNFVLFGL